MNLETLLPVKYTMLVRAGVFQYYKTNDLAHGIDHADAVCDLALNIYADLEKEDLSIITTRKTDLVVKQIIAAAYCHDMFSKRDPSIRRDHHEKAFEFVMLAQVEWLNFFTQEQRTEIALACREHRASWKGGLSSSLSVTIAAADRGRPVLKDFLLRSYNFGKDSLGQTHHEALLHAITHIQTKFMIGGTAQYPKVWENAFMQDLSNMRDDLNKLVDACVDAELENLPAIIDQVETTQKLPLEFSEIYTKME